MDEIHVKYISDPKIDDQGDGNYRYIFTVSEEDGKGGRGYELRVPSNVMERFHLGCVLAFFSALSERRGRGKEELSLKLKNYKNTSLDLGISLGL